MKFAASITLQAALLATIALGGGAPLKEGNDVSGAIGVSGAPAATWASSVR